MKSGCSASKPSAGHSSSAASSSSWYQWSRPSVIGASLSACWTTTIVSSDFRSPMHLVDVRLDRRGLALAARAVDGDERLRLGDLHALLDRLRREAAEDDVVRRADARAGEHRDDDLGDHRQEDPDDVAGLDAEVLQRVGELLDVAVEVGVGDVALLALLAAPVERDAVAVAGLDVAVDAVVGDVELAAHEPLARSAGRTSRAPGPTSAPSRGLRPASPRSPRSPCRPPRRSTRRRPGPFSRKSSGGGNFSCSSSSSRRLSSEVVSAMVPFPLVV